ncbi:helix-turn-helix domain-containing protein [Acutalibacter sp. 1XD8-36]|uniref:helix-turn-helix domain-containing protein n=1 Tax=Acutalibacter sp. 1XD8-36 TaxID=2320852 RepID=UPI001413629C|nr:helix-turn-helix domain-containing protein [Acutalibacter sp. 1XD8-36]NBJ89935.1 XRE family transcriptional regulator [Acutalibacter sp. 1XD8-36]
MTFAERLKKLRLARDLTQKDVYEAVGMSAIGYQRYEYGQREPAYQQLIALADFFDVPTDYLLGRGVFANWDELMDEKSRLLIIASIESHFPELKKLNLSHADERKLMKVLPSFIALIEFSDDMKESSITYKI